MYKKEYENTNTLTQACIQIPNDVRLYGKTKDVRRVIFATVTLIEYVNVLDDVDCFCSFPPSQMFVVGACCCHCRFSMDFHYSNASGLRPF